MNNKKSIGIITFHEPYSYGATMQSLSLQMYLKKQGYKAELIDYSMNGYLQLRRIHRFRSGIIKLLRFFYHPITYCKAVINARQIAEEKKKVSNRIASRNIKFKNFRDKYYYKSRCRYENYLDLYNNPPQYDVYMCGSDQIWNPNFCDMDDSFFLRFANSNKTIAYAPSFGVEKLPIYVKNAYRKRLNGICFLSVREKSGQQIIKELTGKDVPVVVDPTFLVNRSKWAMIADESTIDTKCPYILSYFIGIDKYIDSFIQMLKEVFPEYKIINLVFDKSDYGPEDFLKLIRDSQFVFTNSFHGLALSLNFRVPFAIGKTLKDYGKSSGFSRIDNLLQQVGLENRIVEVGEEIDCSWLNLDFEKVEEKLSCLISQSTKYLNDSIESIITSTGEINE